MLKWSDEKLDGKGYVDWYAFEHPQLGKIELGGWNMQYAWRNPPPQYLEREIAPFAEWLTWHALISPRLELHSAQATPLGDGNYLVRLVVQNTGWLPTYVSKKALERKVVRGVICEVRLPEGAKLLSGKERHDFGQLEGRAYVGSSATPWAVWRAGGTPDRLKAEWVIHAPNGGNLELIARQERSGVVRVNLALS
jgi:hypothetical protein